MKLSQIADRRSDLFFFNIELIAIEEGWNGRTKFLFLDELGDSIKTNGVKTPLKIRRDTNGQIYLVDGERRYRAIKRKIELGELPHDYSVPCTIENSKDISVRLITQLECNTGVPFTLIEKARLYARLRSEGVSVVDMATRSQTSKQAIYQALNIIDKASPHLISLIDDEKISATFALDIISKHSDHEVQNQIADDALAIAQKNGQSKATARNAPDLHPQSDPSDPSDPPEEEEPPTTIGTPTSHKDTVNPPPNPSAYEGLKNAPTTHRDGSSSSSGPSNYAPPEKKIQNLDNHLEKFHYEGEPHLEDTSTSRLNTIEIILDYFRGDCDLKTITRHLQCKDLS